MPRGSKLTLSFPGAGTQAGLVADDDPSAGLFIINEWIMNEMARDAAMSLNIRQYFTTLNLTGLDVLVDGPLPVAVTR